MGELFGRFITEKSKRFVDTFTKVEVGQVMMQVPFFLRSRANSRCGWQLQAVRTKAERELGRIMGTQCITLGCDSLAWNAGGLGTNYEVELVRMSTRELDSDNLVSSFKSIRDGIADAFGTDDGPKGGLQWLYSQERRREHGIRIALKKLSGISTDSTK